MGYALGFDAVENAARLAALPAGSRVLVSRWVPVESCTIAADVEVRPGGGFSVSPGCTLTLAGHVHVPAAFRAFVCGAGAAVRFTASGVTLLPEWWGAKGDGVESCGAAFVAANAALPAGGGRIHLSQGNYLLDALVTIAKSHVVVDGEGTGSLVTCSGAGGFAVGGGQENVKLLNFRLEGAGAGVGILVKANVSVDVVVEKLRISGFATLIQWGEYPGNASYCGTVRDIDLRPVGAQVGIDLVNGCHNMLIEGGSINGYYPGNTSVGIRVARSSGVKISNMNVQGNTGGNVVVTGSVRALVIDGVFFEAFGAAGTNIDLGTAVNPVNNVVEHVTVRDCYTADGTSPAAYSMIIRDGCKAVTVVNNEFRDYATAAIQNLNTDATANLIVRDNRSTTVTLLTGYTGVSVVGIPGVRNFWADKAGFGYPTTPSEQVTVAGAAAGAIAGALALLNTNGGAGDATGVRMGVAADPISYNKGGLFFQRTGAYGKGKIVVALNVISDDSNASNTDGVLELRDATGGGNDGQTDMWLMVNRGGVMALLQVKLAADAGGKRTLYVDTA